MKYSIILFFLLPAQFPSFQTLTTEEIKLYQLIMEYRQKNGLPGIPVSKSLTYVAHMHVQDLANNHPDQGECNAHSWSGKGRWSACCYTADHAKARCMWSKPRELTQYRSNGYEIAFWHSLLATPNVALEGWQSSSEHNAVILNLKDWKDLRWNAIGIGIYQQYAVVWFGGDSD